jgi:PhnB protein
MMVLYYKHQNIDYGNFNKIHICTNVIYSRWNYGFYNKAFGAVELRRWSNDDDSIHVAALKIDEALFHLHEENSEKGNFSPAGCRGITTSTGLLVGDADGIMTRAIAAGAIEISPAQDYDYGYRQGEIAELFGHHYWVIEQII